MSEATSGHRERKKRQTRDAIARAALELFVERGYDATTLAAIADDLGAGPDDLRPQVAAASLTAAFGVLEERERGQPPPHTADEIAAAIDPIIAFVRAGLKALPSPSATSSAR